MADLTSIVTYTPVIVLLQAVLGIVLLLLATLVFDVIHVALHRFAHSAKPLFARIGALHTVHHEFLDRDLRIHEERMLANVLHHVIPEFIVQLLVTASLAAFFPWVSVVIAFVLETAVVVFILWGKPGIDVNHKHVDQLKPYEPMYFCVPEYHLLHHVYPDAFFSSWIKTLDHALGTGISLKHRRILMTDNAQPVNAAFATQLQDAGCELDFCVPVQDLSTLHDRFGRAEILLLSHDRSGRDYLRWLEPFYEQHKDDRLPVEVWEVFGDRTHRHDAAVRARNEFRAQRVIYRQLWIDAKQSPQQNARDLMKKLRRGYNRITAGSWF